MKWILVGFFIFPCNQLNGIQEYMHTVYRNCDALTPRIEAISFSMGKYGNDIFKNFIEIFYNDIVNMNWQL